MAFIVSVSVVSDYIHRNTNIEITKEPSGGANEYANANLASLFDQPFDEPKLVAQNTTTAQESAEKFALIDGKYPIYPYQAHSIPQNYSAQLTAWHPATIKSSLQPLDATGKKIAIIDTGFAMNHSGLSSAWLTNSGESGTTANQGSTPNCTSRGLTLDKSCNNLDDDSNGYVDDWRGWDFFSDDNNPQTGLTSPNSIYISHGTFVAGLAAGSPYGGLGGIAEGAKILPLQALSDDGTGDTLTIGLAIRYAADQGVDVINMSLGSTYPDEWMRTQIQYAISKGVVVVASAGNEGCDCARYPANFPEVVAVGATDSNDVIASFSNFGDNIDISAPGKNMCSYLWSVSNQTGGMGCGWMGTSFASPLVAGSIAVAIKNGASPTKAVDAVVVSADKVAGMGTELKSNIYGAGRLNVYEMLRSLQAPTYSLSNQIGMKLSCPGNMSTCAYGVLNSSGAVLPLVAKKPTSVTGEYLYFFPTDQTISAGLKSLQPSTGVLNQPRTYINFSP